MSSWKNGQSSFSGDTEDRGDLLHHQRSGAEIYEVYRTSDRISCYFEFSSLQSRVVSGICSVWVCLDTESPVGLDCKFGSEAADEGDSERQQQRIQESFFIGRRRKGWFGTSTAENPREDLHRWRVTPGSTHRRERIKEWNFIRI